jgi:hypothetical protein
VAIHIEKQDAETVPRAFVEKIVLLYGTPQILQTNEGANFTGEVFGNTCNLFKIKKIQSTGFIPNPKVALNGVTACWLSTFATTWARTRPTGTHGSLLRLRYITLLDTLLQAILQVTVWTPPSTLTSALKPPEPRYNYDEYASKLKGRLQTAHQQADRNLRAKEKVKSTTRPQDELSYRSEIRSCFFMKRCAAVDPASYVRSGSGRTP